MKWPTCANDLRADINDVRRGIGHDQRIGFQFLFPGPGYGGSCFPKDVNALIHLAQSLDVPVDLMEAVDRVNDKQKQVLPAQDPPILWAEPQG